jgi:hypothetical protein
LTEIRRSPNTIASFSECSTSWGHWLVEWIVGCMIVWGINLYICFSVKQTFVNLKRVTIIFANIVNTIICNSIWWIVEVQYLDEFDWWTQIAQFMLKPSRQKNHLLNEDENEWMNEYKCEGSWQQDLKNLKSKSCTEVWNDQNLVRIEEQFSEFFMNDGECGV